MFAQRIKQMLSTLGGGVGFDQRRATVLRSSRRGEVDVSPARCVVGGGARRAANRR